MKPWSVHYSENLTQSFHAFLLQYLTSCYILQVYNGGQNLILTRFSTPVMKMTLLQLMAQSDLSMALLGFGLTQYSPVVVRNVSFSTTISLPQIRSGRGSSIFWKGQYVSRSNARVTSLFRISKTRKIFKTRISKRVSC